MGLCRTVQKLLYRQKEKLIGNLLLSMRQSWRHKVKGEAYW